MYPLYNYYILIKLFLKALQKKKENLDSKHVVLSPNSSSTYKEIINPPLPALKQVH
jgi:hypothetical protein